MVRESMQVRRLIPDPEFTILLYKTLKQFNQQKAGCAPQKLHEWKAGAALAGLLYVCTTHQK